MPFPFPGMRSRFPGGSNISDGEGDAVHLGDEEAVLVAEVILDPARKTHREPPCTGRWAYPPGSEPKFLHSLSWIETLGRLRDRFSRKRRRAARALV